MSSSSHDFSKPTLPSRPSHVLTTRNGGNANETIAPASAAHRTRPRDDAMNSATNHPTTTAANATGTASAKLLSSSPQLMSVEEDGCQFAHGLLVGFDQTRPSDHLDRRGFVRINRPGLDERGPHRRRLQKPGQAPGQDGMRRAANVADRVANDHAVLHQAACRRSAGRCEDRPGRRRSRSGQARPRRGRRVARPPSCRRPSSRRWPTARGTTPATVPRPSAGAALENVSPSSRRAAARSPPCRATAHWSARPGSAAAPRAQAGWCSKPTAASEHRTTRSARRRRALRARRVGACETPRCSRTNRSADDFFGDQAVDQPHRLDSFAVVNSPHANAGFLLEPLQNRLGVNLVLRGVNRDRVAAGRATGEQRHADEPRCFQPVGHAVRR